MDDLIYKQSESLGIEIGKNGLGMPQLQTHAIDALYASSIKKMIATSSIFVSLILVLNLTALQYQFIIIRPRKRMGNALVFNKSLTYKNSFSSNILSFHQIFHLLIQIFVNRMSNIDVSQFNNLSG